MRTAPRLWTVVRDWPLAQSLAIRYERAAAEVLLISYPKCGRTWLRMLLGRTLQRQFDLGEGNPLDLHKLAQRRPGIPRIYADHEGLPQFKRPGELAASKAHLRQKKVIFLVRDPRDVVVSLYFQKQKRRGQSVGTLSDFLRDEVGSYETLLHYYNIWAANRGVVRGFLLVRYEDLHADPGRELRRALEFLGLDGVADAVIDDAVGFASFENMRAMEAEDRYQSRKLRPADARDEESFKTRRGKVGGYTDYLSPDDVAYLNGRMADVLTDYYGYRP